MPVAHLLRLLTPALCHDGDQLHANAVLDHRQPRTQAVDQRFDRLRRQRRIGLGAGAAVRRAGHLLRVVRQRVGLFSFHAALHDREGLRDGYRLLHYYPDV